MDVISLSSSRNQLAECVETVRRLGCFRHRQKQRCMRTCSTFVSRVDRTVVFSFPCQGWRFISPWKYGYKGRACRMPIPWNAFRPVTCEALRVLNRTSQSPHLWGFWGTQDSGFEQASSRSVTASRFLLPSSIEHRISSSWAVPRFHDAWEKRGSVHLVTTPKPRVAKKLPLFMAHGCELYSPSLAG